MSFMSLDFGDFDAAAGDFDGFAGALDNMRGGLEKIVRDVAIPAMATNFEVGGRPAWEPLSDTTLEIRGSGTPLVRTGRWYSVSQALSNWQINDSEATMESVAGAEYGVYHQEGTRRMVSRPWATLAPEDEDKAEEVMVEWIGEQLGAFNFGVFTSSFGSGDF
jgi:phage gpG-like protein